MSEAKLRHGEARLQDQIAEQEMQLASMLHDEWRATSQFDPSLPEGQFRERVKVLVAWDEGGKQETKWTNEGEELVRIFAEGRVVVKSGDVLAGGRDGKERWYPKDAVPDDVFPVDWFPLATTELFRQDIANTDFPDLHPDFQTENLREARVIGAIVRMGIAAKWLLRIKAIRNLAGTIVNDAWMAAHPSEKGSKRDVGFVGLPRAEQDKDINHIRAGIKTVYPTARARAAATFRALMPAMVG